MVLILTSPPGKTVTTPWMNMLSGSCRDVPNYPLFGGHLDVVPHCIAPQTSLPLPRMPFATAGSLWLVPTHLSKFLWAALSACFPWQVVWSRTSSMLLHDTNNRNCSITLLCSSRNWLSFGKTGSGADFWSSANTESKERSWHWIQGNSENDDPGWNWKCSCSVLETPDNTSASTLKWCDETLFAKPVLLLLLYPKCAESF